MVGRRRRPGTAGFHAIVLLTMLAVLVTVAVIVFSQLR